MPTPGITHEPTPTPQVQIGFPKQSQGVASEEEADDILEEEADEILKELPVIGGLQKPLLSRLVSQLPSIYAPG